MITEKDGCLIFDGYTLIKKSLDCVPTDTKKIILTISPNSYGISVKDKKMNEALKGADFLQLDGVYFGWLPWFRYGKKATRITGWDSFIYYANKLQQCEGKMFFLGSTEETLNIIRQNMKRDFSNVQIKTYSPPYKNEFDDDDNRLMHEAINKFKPDVLVVGMTAPKQEKWSFQNKNFIDAHIIICIGNVFDWYAGNAKRPNLFWQKIGMEWLVRVFYRPEIFKRNIANQMRFFRHLFLDLLHIRPFAQNTENIK